MERKAKMCELVKQKTKYIEVKGKLVTNTVKIGFQIEKKQRIVLFLKDSL